MNIQIRRYILFVILSLALLFTSCAPQYYNAIKQNVKVFEKKGDITASVSGELIYNQLGVDAGYALTDNIGINTSYNRFNRSRFGNETNPFVKDFIWDNELIIFKNFKFGLFGATNFGFGIGGFNVCNPYYSLNMERYYAQPSLGYMFSDAIGIAFSARFVQSNYNYKMKGNGYSLTETNLIQSYFELNALDKSVFHVEPAITLLAKIRKGTWKLQYIQSYAGHIDYSQENFVLSYSLNLNSWFRKQHRP